MSSKLEHPSNGIMVLDYNGVVWEWDGGEKGDWYVAAMPDHLIIAWDIGDKRNPSGAHVPPTLFGERQ